MATDLHKPDACDNTEDAADKGTTKSTDAGSERLGKARAAFAQQRENAGARAREWFDTKDLHEGDILDEVTKTRARQQATRETELEREIARLHARFSTAKAQAKHAAEGEGPVDTGHLAGLAGQIAAKETELGHLRAQAERPITNRDLVKARNMKRATRAGIAAAGSLGTFVAGSHALTMALHGNVTILGGLGVAAGYGWYLISRPFAPGQPVPTPAPALPGQPLAAPVNMAKTTATSETSAPEPQVPVQRAFDAPPPPALTAEELDQALRNIGEVKPHEQIQILAVPQRDGDGNTTVVFDLPPRTTVAELKKKLPKLAGALGRDVSMVDIEKAGTEVRTSLWLTDRDPFEDTRPSPLIKTPAQLDAWKDGVPVAWNKRGVAIRLAINNQSYVIAGMTRSGKGVGASNLVVGAAFDPRINLRIVAGKNNGEWDPYAKAGVASTYFKPSPERLLALLKSLLADKDRRERDLGKLGKSKLVPVAIEQIGGVEVLVIDELATYTRPGKPLRDDILEALIELSAVAAGAGILLVLITQYPEVDVIPQALAMNCGARWAMRVENATQSNAILGAGQSGAGRDASKFDPPRPGFGWLVNPFAGVTDLARSFDLDEDERGEITMLLEKAAKIRERAGRLAWQWEDPIEKHLLNATGLSSAAGGPKRDGVPGRNVLHHTKEQQFQIGCCRQALVAMDRLGRDVAQLDEMARIIGAITGEELGEQLRAAGAGGTVKVTIPGQTNRVNGYRRTDIADALSLLEGN
ncbi:hypothetical protein [Streptomyces odontomachi]|uniref:hypothetical protein n=1 Tax=Streptomyces odontomachi TaxID=2944940 RepID=UPI00210B0C8D|nr:hypothetical protein [Streptomyces sp. ODS25]